MAQPNFDFSISGAGIDNLNQQQQIELSQLIHNKLRQYQGMEPIQFNMLKKHKLSRSEEAAADLVSRLGLR